MTKWAWRIGRVAGINIYLHWTFLLLLGWIFSSFLIAGKGAAAATMGAGFIIALFGCVVLHELGHALTAQRFGIQTRDIILLPIGGVARLQRMPEDPRQEFIVAVAGPAVNVLIAGVLCLALIVAVGPSNLAPGEMFSGRFVQNLMWANIALVLFNLLPAFPMDGGRMLRALLATRIDYLRATEIAASVGQFMAILFAIAGIFWIFNPFLVFIALFVFLGAAGEAKLTEIRLLLEDVPVTQAMIRHFRALRPNDPIPAAADALLEGWQPDFPVVDNGRYVGFLHRRDLTEALKQGNDGRIADVMQTDCPVIEEREVLSRVMEQLQQAKCAALPVVRDDQLVGVVTTENIGELLMIRSAMRDTASAHSQMSDITRI